jgi:hypothetical protein
MAAPVVTANFTRLQLGETISLDDLFEYSDADADPIASVTIRDLGIDAFGGTSVGSFFVNGVPAGLDGNPFVVLAADIPNTVYRADFINGGEFFQVTASDGTEVSATSENQIRVGNTAPTVTALPSVVPLLGQIPFLSMIRVTDAEMDPIVEYRVRDNNGAGTSGGFILGGNRFPANQWHSFTAAEARRLVFEGGSDFTTESFSVTVDDGIRSAVSANQVTSGNERPVITGNANLNVLENQRVPVSSFFNISDADNDPIARYYVVDRRDNEDSGFLELNGERLASATFHSLTAIQFASLQYVGAPEGPKFEDVGLQVFDGFALSETVDVNVDTTTPAVVQATNKTSVIVDEVVPVSELFNAFDPDGRNIREYFLVDRRPNADGGFLTVNGVRQPSAVWFRVAAEDLDTVNYVGASRGPQTESLGIQANDGTSWSEPVDLPILTATRPTVATIDGQILEAYLLDVAPLVDGRDANGNPADFYRFTDTLRNSNGGYFEFRGSRLPSGEFFEVSAAELNDLKYRGGGFGVQSEEIQVQVLAGGVISDTESFTITTLENTSRPTVKAFDVDAVVGSVIDVQSMFSWDDADGIPPTQLSEIRLFDTGTRSDSGFFSVNGVRQPAGEWFAVDIANVESGAVKYHVSGRTDNELYRITVNDGRFVSQLDTGRARAIATPVLEASQNDFSVDTIERIQIGNFISQTDQGPPLVEYQVFDENVDVRSGRLELDGNDLQQGIVHTLTAAQFDRLVFKGAEADFGRQLDGYIVRGTNAAGLSSGWTRFNVNTDPVGNEALITGFQMDNRTNTPVTEVTFTFIDGGNQTGGTRQNPNYPPLPTYYPPEVADGPGREALNTRAWSQEQRESTRVLLESISKFANIRFREVAFGDGTASDAQITFGSWGNFDGSVASAAAYAYLPVDGDGRGNFFGDIWFDWTDLDWDPTTPTEVGPGSFWDYTVLHEVGHAIGFDHPFEGFPALSIFNNFDYNTVMAYEHFNSFSQFDEAYPESPASFMLYDIVELQRLYGVRETYNPENNHYRFDDAHQLALYDTGGIDTVNLTRNEVDTIVDLREGQRSTLQNPVVTDNPDGSQTTTFEAYDNSLLIPYGVVIENARTGSGNDTLGGNEISNLLIGNAGNDELTGRGGNDDLRGGLGDDTYVWNLGDGRDFIIESGDSGPRGVDRLEFRVRTGQLDLLEDDFVFRRLGNDLRIDLTLNRGNAQGSVVIKGFDQVAGRVETLALYGPPVATGQPDQQIGSDIDLTSIWNASETLGQRFEVTNQTTAFGVIAQPV